MVRPYLKPIALFVMAKKCVDLLVIGRKKYPAPPLNGTAHAWHHSPLQLLKTINEGGIKMGGQMPAFENTLSDDEKQAALDYIMSLWPRELKTKYDERFK